MRLEHSDCGSGALERCLGLECVHGELHHFVRTVRSAVDAMLSVVSIGNHGRSVADARDRGIEPIETAIELQRTDAH